MIKELYENGYLNIEKMILNEANKLGISQIEAVVLLKIMECFNNKRSINKDYIKLKTSISDKELDNILTSLLQKGLYEIYLSYEDSMGEEYISLDPLFKHLESSVDNVNVVNTSDLETVINIIQTKLNKLLSSNEYEYVCEWVLDLNISKEEMINIINDIECSGKKLTFRSLAVSVSNYSNKGSNNVNLEGLLKNIRR